MKIFADSAKLEQIAKLVQLPYVKGFTTNPTIMRKDGVSDYEYFAKSMLHIIGDLPVSFEVFADEFSQMEVQARKVGSWGPNVYVKIPITNTKRESSCLLIKRLAEDRVKVNVTAVMALEQIKETIWAMKNVDQGVISVLAGRIADTGVAPVPFMIEALKIIKDVNPRIELLWASPRELLNIVEADRIGCDIITVSNEILSKLSLMGKDLFEYSLETVKMFYNDASSAGYTL
ncbi:MAG: transaldolase [Oligoflexia bacterium]|nr:transaldolase [Oligoflexia bacterium]